MAQATKTRKPVALVPAPLRITCRACERAGDQIASGVLLCVECASDIDGLRTHIQDTLKSHHDRISETWGALEQQIESADEALLARWNAFQDAVTFGKPEARQAERKASNGMPGPLADLIRLWTAWRDAMGIYAERKNWGDRAELALDLFEGDLL